jgi:hypothetical protein
LASREIWALEAAKVFEGGQDSSDGLGQAIGLSLVCSVHSPLLLV